MMEQSKKLLPRLVLHLFLITFSLVFLFPFLWMICGSMKLREEMAGEKSRLLPTAPRVVGKTPYFRSGTDSVADVPEDIPEAVWKRVLPELEERIQAEMKSWKPSLPGEKIPMDLSFSRDGEWQPVMVREIIRILSSRISDRARNAAFNAVKNSAAAGQIPADGIEMGKKAVLEEVETILTTEIYENAFNRIFQRICLGEVKFRVDHRIQKSSSEAGWKVIEGEASLINRNFNNSIYQLVNLDYRRSPQVCFAYAPETVPEKVDRIYLSLRGDAAWSRIFFEVICNGRRYRTDEAIQFSGSEWFETTLLPDSGNIRSGTSGGIQLYESGPAPENAPSFEIRMYIRKNSQWGAWVDKALRNYRIVFKELPFARYIMTSFALCILNIVLTVFSCTFAAYGFSRLEWFGRDFFFGVMIATMMIPQQVLMLPNFLINRELGFYNTLIPLWLYSAFGNAFFIFLLRQFMKTIPKSLEEAAMMDGCGFLGIYWHVILPLLKPTIATISIFTFTGCWNNFMGPLIYVNDEALFPLALGLFKFNLVSGSDTGLMMAGSFLMTLPVIILFFFAQKYFIQGITLTGNKE